VITLNTKREREKQIVLSMLDNSLERVLSDTWAKRKTRERQIFVKAVYLPNLLNRKEKEDRIRKMLENTTREVNQE